MKFYFLTCQIILFIHFNRYVIAATGKPSLRKFAIIVLLLIARTITGS